MRKTLALLASAALMSLTLAAHADSYSYMFTNTVASTNISFVSTTLITSTTLLFTSPTVSGLSCSFSGITCDSADFDIGGLGNVIFVRSTGNGAQMFNGMTNAFFSTVGTNISGNNQLIIAALPAATAATPEPSSLVLLGTGVLGVFGAARRRFLKA